MTRDVYVMEVFMDQTVCISHKISTRAQPLVALGIILHAAALQVLPGIQPMLERPPQHTA